MTAHEGPGVSVLDQARLLSASSGLTRCTPTQAAAAILDADRDGDAWMQEEAMDSTSIYRTLFGIFAVL